MHKTAKFLFIFMFAYEVGDCSINTVWGNGALAKTITKSIERKRNL